MCSLKRVVTYTTKKLRAGEVEGVSYHTLSPYEFEHKLAQGFFIEHSTAYGTYYGSPRSVLSDVERGDSYIMVVDQVGARSIKREYPKAILIWVTVPTLTMLAHRLQRRATETDEQKKKRLALAEREMNQEKQEGLFEHHINNVDFEQAAAAAIAIINRGC